MATTRLIPMHVIKGQSIATTVHQRVDYAANPIKTENGELILSYGCDPKTAASEMLICKKEYATYIGRTEEKKSDVILYQIRQSFKPGEITPELAQKSVTSLPCDLLKETISSSSRLTQTMHISTIILLSTLFLWITHRNSETYISPVTPFETSAICSASKTVFPSSIIQKMHQHTMVNGLAQIERSHGRKSLEIALIRLLLSTHPILMLYWVSSNSCHTKSEKEIYSFLKHQVKSIYR